MELGEARNMRMSIGTDRERMGYPLGQGVDQGMEPREKVTGHGCLSVGERLSP